MFEDKQKSSRFPCQPFLAWRWRRISAFIQFLCCFFLTRLLLWDQREMCTINRTKQRGRPNSSSQEKKASAPTAAAAADGKDGRQRGWSFSDPILGNGSERRPEEVKKKRTLFACSALIMFKFFCFFLGLFSVINNARKQVTIESGNKEHVSVDICEKLLSSSSSSLLLLLTVLIFPFQVRVSQLEPNAIGVS